MAGCLGDDDDDGNGNGNGDEEVLANAGNNVVGKVGEAVTFNASLSSGPIKKYWWDVDLGNASTPLTEDLVGQEVSHTYMAAGKYIITLTVEGEGEKNSTDTVTAFIDRVDDISSSLSLTTLNSTHEYPVTEDVQAIRLTLSYPSTTGDIIPVPILLDMDVYGADTQPIATSTSEPYNPQESPQVKNLDLAQHLATIAANDGFRVVVRWTLITEPVGDVDFDLKVEVMYSAA
jgi:PKD repeat protein